MKNGMKMDFQRRNRRWGEEREVKKFITIRWSKKRFSWSVLDVPVRPVSGCFTIAAAGRAANNVYGCLPSIQLMTFSGIYILRALIHYKFVIRYLLSHYNYFPSLCLKPNVLLRDLDTHRGVMVGHGQLKSISFRGQLIRKTVVIILLYTQIRFNYIFSSSPANT